MVRDTLHDPRHPLGGTDLTVSPLGLDTVRFGCDQGVKYPSSFTIPDDHEAAGLLTLAHDLGINLIDTAPAYGRSEEHLGPLLRGQRKHWVIVSKVGEEFVDGQSVFDFSATRTRRSVEHSLKRLGTKRIKLVLMHSDGNDLDIFGNSEAYPTLIALKHRGLIGVYGLSDKTVEGGLRILCEDGCAMITYDLNERAERLVIEYATTHTKGILVKKALASGYACLGVGQDPVRASFELVFDRPGIVAAIVGIINPLHLAHNVAMAAQALRRA